MTASASAAPTETPPAARIIVTMVAMFTMLSPYLADWNETHIYNPRWPPHAKFHNAQTLLMGSMLGACALYFLWRRGGEARVRFHAATLFAGLYWLTQMGSIAVPGPNSYARYMYVVRYRVIASEPSTTLESWIHPSELHAARVGAPPRNAPARSVGGELALAPTTARMATG